MFIVSAISNTKA